MQLHDTQWFDETMPTPQQLSKATHPELPLWDPQVCGDDTESLVITRTGGVPLDCTNLRQLLVTHSFNNIPAIASQIGVKQGKVEDEALKQKIRLPLSSQLAMKLGREKLKSIRSDLCAGVAKEQVARMHAVAVRTIRLIELDTPGLSNTRKSATARKIRDVHRARVLEIAASNLHSSRGIVRERAAGTYLYMLAQDREWFDKTVPQRRRGRGSGPRKKRFDRGQLDSELAEKFIHVVHELKSTSPPIRITKHRVVYRAGCLKYFQYSADLPKSRAVLNEYVETMPDYQARKIRWAIAEMERNGQVITEGTVREKTGFWPTVIHQHKQLVHETAQQLGANAGPLFGRGF